MQGINVVCRRELTPAEADKTKARAADLHCMEELKKSTLDKRLDTHGIIVIRTPAADDVGGALQRSIWSTLECSRKRRNGDLQTNNRYLNDYDKQAWQESFLSKVTLESLESRSTKSVIFCALLKGTTDHLPLVTAWNLLKQRNCWLIIQQLEGADKEAPNLFASPDDSSFISADVSYTE